MNKACLSAVILMSVLLLMAACSSNARDVSFEATPAAVQTSAAANLNQAEASDTIETPLGDQRSGAFQSGNVHPFLPLSFRADDLADTRLNALVSFCIITPSDNWMGWTDNLKSDGFTSARFTLNAIDGPNVDLSYSYIEEDIPDEYVDVYRYLKESGIQTRCSLSFWDMVYRQNGGTISLSRLGSEDEMERYLDYITMVVTRLKGLVDSYELWNEPDANPDFYQYITTENYVSMAQRAIPIIRKIDPDAKIVYASTSSYIEEACQQYSMQLLSSDIVAQTDAISLHTVNNDASPVFHSDYYYGYDAMWNEIKAAAESQGFNGEYIADELNYRSNYSISVLQPETGPYHPYEPEVAAKYIGRMIVINRGMDISVGTSGTNSDSRPIEGTMIRNMAYLLEGLDACDFPVTVESDCEYVRYYTFADASGSRYIAIWNDGAAEAVSSIEKCNIMIEKTDAESATACDPFNSVTQALDFSVHDGSTVLNGILLRDYPILIKLG